MSAAKKAPAKKHAKGALTDAQIWRWLAAHYVTGDPGPIPRSWCPQFSKLVAVVDRFADKANMLSWAMHNPGEPGAAEILADACEITADTGKGSFEYHSTDIQDYGKAISWAMRGEPVEEVEAERARVAAFRAESEHMCRARAERSTEDLERGRACHLEPAFQGLVNVICCEESFTANRRGGFEIAESTPADRRAIVARLRRELLTDDASPTKTCRGCGTKSRWAERWAAEDLCYSPFCAEKAARS